MVATLERVPTREVVDPQTRHAELRDMLWEALGIDPKRLEEDIPSLLPAGTFGSPEDILVKSMDLAQKVRDAWQPSNSNHHFRPDDDVLVRGLLDFGVHAVQILEESPTNTPAENPEEGILQVITRIRGAVETSDRRGNVRKRNLRTDRDDLHIRFSEALNRSSKTNL